MSTEAIQHVVAMYYALLRTAHVSDTYVQSWIQLWDEAAIMEDPVGTAFGRATGREQIGERLRHNLASMFDSVDIHEQVVIIQPLEHYAAVYWTARMTYRNEALVYPGKRGKVYTIDGMTLFTLNHTDSAIVSLAAVWDYALLL
jgi:hypothetical protein